jgi:peroxiredoxin Q/BCP
MTLTKTTLAALILLVAGPLAGAAAEPPAMGEKAPAFTLATMQGRKMSLSDVTGKGDVVLVVLRGYPGYQCPFCTRQVQEFVAASDRFQKMGAEVVFIYPGPPDDLASKAAESAAGKELPEHFIMLLDPGYDFTNLYGLRWDAPKETAYPSTFLLNKKGEVYFQKISKGHGGRTSANEILEALAGHR